MVTEIRIYLEGDPQLRPAFGIFLQELRSKARERKIRWEIIACGARDRAYRDFQRALIDHPDAFVILLVDSEGPVTRTPWEHLKHRTGDGWDCPDGADDSQCHLMVQMMEAWFFADIKALIDYYGKDFNAKALPKEADVERIDKAIVESSFKEATRQTKKRKYHKTKHAPDLLQRLDPEKVRKAARHCNRLFVTLESKIDPPSPPEPATEDHPLPAGPGPT